MGRRAASFGARSTEDKGLDLGAPWGILQPYMCGTDGKEREGKSTSSETTCPSLLALVPTPLQKGLRLLGISDGGRCHASPLSQLNSSFNRCTSSADTARSFVSLVGRRRAAGGGAKEKLFSGTQLGKHVRLSPGHYHHTAWHGAALSVKLVTFLGHCRHMLSPPDADQDRTGSFST